MNASYSLLILNFDEKSTLKIGRGFESDVRLNDISVSRLHALIKMSKGRLYLKDMNSKFGTQVAMKENYLLEDD